jgi:hypothetical protein
MYYGLFYVFVCYFCDVEVFSSLLARLNILKAADFHSKDVGYGGTALKAFLVKFIRWS